MKVISSIQRTQELTFSQGVERFLTAGASRNLSPFTLDWYKERLDSFEKFLRQKTNPPALQDITTADIQEFLQGFFQYQRERGRSDHTVRRTYDALKILFGFAHRENMVFVNPMHNIPTPRTSRKLMQPLTQEEIIKLLAAPDKKSFRGFRDYLMIVLFLETGLRLNEALTLKVSDVNFQDGTLLVFGKGRKQRKVPFGQTLRGLLTQYIQWRGNIPGQDLLFVNQFGQKLKRRRVQQYLTDYAVQAGIQKPVHPHILRHTFALNFILQGGNPFVLQEILGHTTLDMTRRYVSLANQSFAGQRVSFMDKLAEQGHAALPKRKLF